MVEACLKVLRRLPGGSVAENPSSVGDTVAPAHPN